MNSFSASRWSKPFVETRYWMSSVRNRSCAVKRFRTCESGYSGLSIRFVERSPSNCHLNRSRSGCTSGTSARRGFGFLGVDVEGPGSALLFCLRSATRVQYLLAKSERERLTRVRA